MTAPGDGNGRDWKRGPLAVASAAKPPPTRPALHLPVQSHAIDYSENQREKNHIYKAKLVKNSPKTTAIIFKRRDVDIDELPGNCAYRNGSLRTFIAWLNNALKGASLTENDILMCSHGASSANRQCIAYYLDES